MHRKGSVSTAIFASYREPKWKIIREKIKRRGDEFIDAQNWSLEVGLTSSLGASILKTQKFSRLFPPKCVTFTVGQAPHVDKYDKCHSIPSGGFHGLQKTLLFHEPQWKSSCISLAWDGSCAHPPTTLHAKADWPKPIRSQPWRKERIIPSKPHAR